VGPLVVNDPEQVLQARPSGGLCEHVCSLKFGQNVAHLHYFGCDKLSVKCSLHRYVC